MIAIIGAGPAGGQAAYELANAGEDVHVFEDHPCVGEPVACTGLLTKTVHELLTKEELRSVLVNTLEAVDVIPPTGQPVRIPTHEYIVDRAGLDKMLMKKAQDAGATLHLHHRFVGRKGDEILLRHNGAIIRRKIDALVGADGPRSDVAKSASLYGRRQFYIGLQVTLTGSFDRNVFTTWFGEAAPDFFAWSVPETDSLARVGLATRQRTRAYFDAFLKRLGGNVIATQAGPIPLYSPLARASDERERVFLVGDAALINKATTGGGIIVGMRSGGILATSLLEETSYEAALAPLRRELGIHLLLRRALNHFAATDYDSLVGLMRNDAVRRILTENTREDPSRFMLKLLAAQPGLLRFAPKGLLGILHDKHF